MIWSSAYGGTASLQEDLEGQLVAMIVWHVTTSMLWGGVWFGTGGGFLVAWVHAATPVIPLWLALIPPMYPICEKEVDSRRFFARLGNWAGMSDICCTGVTDKEGTPWCEYPRPLAARAVLCCRCPRLDCAVTGGKHSGRLTRSDGGANAAWMRHPAGLPVASTWLLLHQNLDGRAQLLLVQVP